jgi:hypothetical protein
MRHLDDLTTIEAKIAEILKPSKKDRDKAKGYKKNLKRRLRYLESLETVSSR